MSSLARTQRSAICEDVFHPVTAEGRQALNDAVLSEYSIALDAIVQQKETAQALEGANKARAGIAPDNKVRKHSEPER